MYLEHGKASRHLAASKLSAIKQGGNLVTTILSQQLDATGSSLAIILTQWRLYVKKGGKPNIFFAATTSAVV